MKNKRGGEKIFSIWWFFVLGVVGLSIIGMTMYYYLADADIKKLEADSLSETLFNCISSSSYLTEEFFGEEFDVFKKCGFSKETLFSGDFYFNITVFNEDKTKILKEVHNGTGSFDSDCRIVLSGEVKGKNYPKCTETERMVFFSEKGERKNAIIYILTASNQKGKK